ncbi:FecR domain-containing protein [Magnetovibrio blakemorei]|uniref:FecR protein domain-containing protein n=1 Tax=Magnetovibrio blakemorei TaxID=28181 RepID=A0A1E5Q9L4_9PROT|nr:FecR domain-containing protein [Magnetovibrio blakemorei]OEJ68374.1 hypothetical protein BEN30_06335 [Magnetovibrio blakemorei]
MATNDLGNTPLDATGANASTTIEATTSDMLTLPDGLNPATADFAHEGPDLVMTWPDGSEVVVTDYFTMDPLPDLSSAQGAQVAGDLAGRLAGSVAPGMVAQAGAEGVAEQPIGQVENLQGTVTAIRADGTRVELKVGDPVYQGDILETGADGSIGVILADETTFSMAEDGRMVLDEMVYDPGTQEGSVSLSVMQGVFTFVSGQVAKTDPDAMSLHTPVATIGIRGTQVGLDIKDGQTLDIALMEESDGFIGEVVVMNGAGVSVLNGANEFTVVHSFSTSPSATSTISSDQMISQFSSALRHLPLTQPNANDFGLQASGINYNEYDTAAGGAQVGGDALAEIDTTSVTDVLDTDLANWNVASGDTGQTGSNDSHSAMDVDHIASAILTKLGGTDGPPSEPKVSKDPKPSSDPKGHDDPTSPPPDSAAEPVITFAGATGNEDGSFDLNITVAAGDPNDTISDIIISGDLHGGTLSAGTDNGNGTWTVTQDQLNGLQIIPKGDYSGTFDLSVSATATSSDNTDTASSSTTASVNVNPVADAPT